MAGPPEFAIMTRSRTMVGGLVDGTSLDSTLISVDSVVALTGLCRGCRPLLLEDESIPPSGSKGSGRMSLG